MYCQRIWHNPSDQVIIQRILVAIMKGLEPLIPLPQRLSRELRSLPTYRRGGSVSWNPLEPQNWCLAALWELWELQNWCKNGEKQKFSGGKLDKTVEKYHREKDCRTKETTKLVLGSPLGATKLIQQWWETEIFWWKNWIKQWKSIIVTKLC